MLDYLSFLIIFGLIFVGVRLFKIEKKDINIIILIISQVFFINVLPELDTFMDNNNLLSNNFMLFMSLGIFLESSSALGMIRLNYTISAQDTAVTYFVCTIAIWTAFLFLKLRSDFPESFCKLF